MQTQTTLLTYSPLSIESRNDTANLTEVLQYGTDADCRALLELIADELRSDTILDLRDQIETLEGEKADAEFKLENELDTYKDFFEDVLREAEEYGGRYPCAEPYNIAPIVADTFREHDEMRTTLANIKQAIKDGESLEYISSLIED